MTGKLKIEFPQHNLSLDKGKLGKSFVDLGIISLSAFCGLITSPDGFLSPILNAKDSIEINYSPEEKAGKIVLALSLATFRYCTLQANNIDEKEISKIIQSIKKIITNNIYYIDEHFFSRPTSLPLYQDIRNTLHKITQGTLKNNSYEIEKIDSVFNCMLYEFFKNNVELTSELHSIVNGPGIKILNSENEWTKYREFLKYRFYTKPTFGQESSNISLSQLYIHPRAKFFTFEKSESKHNNLEEEKIHGVVDLLNDTIDWINAKDHSRKIRLIKGGPGSGKSSFTKQLSALICDKDNFRPIFIELQSIKKCDDLQSRVTELLIEQEEHFTESPFTKKTLDEHKPLILIFDGLDELAVPDSQGAKRIAEEFWDELDDMLGKLNTSTKLRAMAVVTGRDAIIDAILSSRYGRKFNTRDALHICGLHKIDNIGGTLKNPQNIDLDDQRSAWWKKYAEATGNDQTTPPVFSSTQLGSITDEPLLCYLLAISGKAEESKKREIHNINEIYEKLIEDVWLRVWGDDQTKRTSTTNRQKLAQRQAGPIAAFEDLDEFKIILEYVAVAAWRNGKSRTATYEEFETSIRQTVAEDVWERFSEAYSSSETDETFSTLALTFFFKKSDLHSRGFEFSHRSFGEYLAAMCITRQLFNSRDRLRLARTPDELSDWVRLTSGAALTFQIAIFIENELQRYPIERLVEINDGLINAYNLCNSKGFPVRIGEIDCWKDAERRHSNAEQSLFVCLSAANIAILSKTENQPPLKLNNTPKNQMLRDMINRFDTGDIDENNVHKMYFRNLDLTTNDAGHEIEHLTERKLRTKILFNDYSLTFMNLFDYNFSNSKLDHLNIINSGLSSSLFHNCSMHGTDLSGAILVSTEFHHADMREALLTRCRGSRPSFWFANLTEAKLDDSSLPHADFRFATLLDAVFYRAELDHAAFNECDAKRANFNRATLRECSFRDANLRYASFVNADVKNCDFSGADLRNTSGLTARKLAQTNGDANTKLSPKIKRPERWSIDDGI